MLKFQHYCAFTERDCLPTSMALYAVYAGDLLLYIGMSQSLKARFPNHHKLEEFYANYANLICYTVYEDLEALANAEVKAIKKHQPLLNATVRAYSAPSRATWKGQKPELPKTSQNLYTATFNHLWEFIESSKTGLDALRQIEKDTGLNVPWLRTFAKAKTKEPSVIRVETLYVYLTGKELQL